ncbi:MAG: signal peptide peptidase SppA [Planctomycetota bacterium]
MTPPARIVRIVPVLALVAAAAGCGNVGWVVKPVPLEEELVETTVRRDAGLVVPHKIAVVDVDGLLVNRRERGLLGMGENPVSLFIEKLDKAAEDRNVRAVVLRINSPGGGVTASDIMYRRLMRFRQRRKVPVVAIIEDVGASGGYYLACGADTIVAHPTSVTGSIGVLVQTVSFAGTMDKLGIDAEAVTSGPYKDLASPLKPLDDDDRAILQAMVHEYYQRFCAVVGAGRSDLSDERVKALADGRVYTGRQAAANGLVDAAGDMDDAIAAAKKLAGVDRVRVVMYHRPWGAKPNAHAAGGLPAQLNLVNITVPGLMDLARPRFLYLWTGRR